MRSSFCITRTIPGEEVEQKMSQIESLARKVFLSSTVLSTKMNNRLLGYLSAIPLKSEAFQKNIAG